MLLGLFTGLVLSFTAAFGRALFLTGAHARGFRPARQETRARLHAPVGRDILSQFLK
jgi:hypothetical protein